MKYIYYVLCFILIFIIILLLKPFHTIEEGFMSISSSNNELPKLNMHIKPISSNVVLDDNNQNSINATQYNLIDFYVKTAYNSCAEDTTTDSSVDIKYLKRYISEGCRCVEMEIYSLNNEPIVGSSGNDKTTYFKSSNYITFKEVFECINDKAFHHSYAPNYTDPFIIYMTMKSSNIHMYKNLISIINKNNHKLLPKELSYYYMRNNGINVKRNINNTIVYETTNQLNNVPISYLLGSLLLIMEVDDISIIDNNENLQKIINIVSNPSSTSMTSFYYADVLSNQPGLPMTEYCKYHLAFIKPNKGTSISNNNMVGKNARKQGAQFISIQYGGDNEEEKSGDAKEMDMFFNLLSGNTDQQIANKSGKGCAFMIKDISLRYIPVVVEKPKTIDVSTDYGVRHIEQPKLVNPLTKTSINIIPNTKY